MSSGSLPPALAAGMSALDVVALAVSALLALYLLFALLRGEEL